MELFLLTVLLILCIVLLTRQSNTREVLSKKISDLAKQLSGLQKQLDELSKRSSQPAQPPVIKPEPAVPKEIVVAPPPIAEPPKPPVEQIANETIASAPKTKTYLEELEERRQKAAAEPPKAFVPQEGWYERWLRNNPDLEKFIGENLANKIGIAVLVLGIAFFVKYAIDKDWIKEGGRIAIGLICGGILTGLAHSLRNSYRSFSSVLVGGGLCIFYFTIGFAYHEYGMMSQWKAFASMVVITAFAVTLSLLYNRLELAVLATIGGFITPFLVSNGSNNYVALFTYLAILNVGLLVMAYFKRWPAINVIALFFTLIIYGSWLGLYSDAPGFSARNALLFATLFYGLFVATNTINNLREKRLFTAFDFCILLSINCLYYTAGIIILKEVSGGMYKGLFTAALGVFNLAMAWVLFRNKKADKNFIYLLIGLTLTYISLVAPVQLSGHNITLFWAAECVLLYWLYRRSGIVLLKMAAILISALSIVSLAMDLQQSYGGAALLPVVINKAFITAIVVAVAHLLFYLQVKKADNGDYVAGVPNKLVSQILLILFILLFYSAGALEINYQLGQYQPGTGAKFIYLQLYTFCFAFVLLLSFNRYSAAVTNVRNGILALCFGMYVLYISSINSASQNMLVQGNGLLFSGHWLADVFFIGLAIVVIHYIRKNSTALSHFLQAFSWTIAIAILIFISVEVGQAFVWLRYSGVPDGIEKLNGMYSKAGITITWALSSFVLMWLGMKHRYKPLRILSLSLFCLALLKLFLWDIRNIGEGGKIAAFIMLGVLLLIISFMYQRLKKLFADDEAAGK